MEIRNSIKRLVLVLVLICVFAIVLLGCENTEQKGHEYFYYADFDKLKTVLDNNVKLESDVFNYDKTGYTAMRTEYLVCDLKSKFSEIKDENSYIRNGYFPPFIFEIENIDHFPTIGILHEFDGEELVLINVTSYAFDKEFIDKDLKRDELYYTSMEFLPGGRFSFPKLYKSNQEKGCSVKSFVTRMQNRKEKYASVHYILYSKEGRKNGTSLLEFDFYYKKYNNKAKGEFIKRNVEIEEEIVNYFIDNYYIWSNWEKHDILKAN